MELEEARQILIDLNLDPDKIASNGESMAHMIMDNIEIVNKNDFISNVSKCDYCGSTEVVEDTGHCKPCSVFRFY